MPKQYRKKPVVIEAMQVTVNNLEELEAFVGGDLGVAQEGQMVIATLEGAMKVSIGDYVIRGVAGEFYPCKPLIFETTYEPVTETA
jgi:hypothetical protein